MTDHAPQDARRHAPATARNREPILAILRDVLPTVGTVLEVASGSGEHAIHFSAALPGLSWQPSDPDADALASIAAWRAAEGPGNMLAPVQLDASASAWPVDAADAIVCINMIHISPWDATLGLISGAARILPSGAPLVLYGPYRREGHALASSNVEFDADLKRRDPRWGLRLLEDVACEADTAGFALGRVEEMPANNLTVVFKRR